MKRTPKGYDGTLPTTKNLSTLLPEWFAKIGERFSQRPDLVLLLWPEVIGEKFASMTRAVSFIEGVLVVHVSNSSLYGLLVQHEKGRLKKELQSKIQSVKIKDILFRLGS